ncbi:hypothetical protein [Verrucomicrobium spinosum]|uniref:hypothetical protein n=1 Tax=Verrucomicrobium spinosum TaxID=2736 RepID=UPI0012E1B528|nr:hypothetical protein [Verrucomicrobium spinosum]
MSPAGNEETVLKLDGKLMAMAWNAEGDQLVLACTAMRTYRWRAGTKEMENRLRPRDSATIGFVWHPGGRHIACVAADGVLWIWDLDRADEVIAESLARWWTRCLNGKMRGENSRGRMPMARAGRWWWSSPQACASCGVRVTGCGGRISPP